MGKGKDFRLEKQGEKDKSSSNATYRKHNKAKLIHHSKQRAQDPIKFYMENRS